MSEPIMQSGKNGPIRVSGPVTLVDESGTSTEQPGDVYICRCSGSMKKPFCDGTHKKSGFEGPVFSLEK